MTESYSEVIETLKDLLSKPREVRNICWECGCKHGNVRQVISTWHIGRCAICLKEKSVTDPRGFGIYPYSESEAQND